jgi:uncharacterized damage-inducible protein DinB
MLDGLLECWCTHDEINLYLLRHIPDEGFAAATLLKNGQPSKGRNVARIFRHMHEVRRSYIGREFLKGIPHFDDDYVPTRAELLHAFASAGAGVEQRLRRIAEDGTRTKGRSGMVLLGFLISHDSHHRGQIVLALKQSGVRTPELVKFGIWAHWFKPEAGILDG